jgi:hypothetical protein
MRGRSWKHASPEALRSVRAILIRRGAVQDKEVSNPHELWRVRIERVVFTAYANGTLYCSGGSLLELAFLYESISRILGIP